MKKIFFILGIILLNIFITYGLIHYFVLSKNILITENTTLERDIGLTEESLTLEKGSLLKGNIELAEGRIYLDEQARIEGDISLGKGELIVGKNASIKGTVTITAGRIRLEENASIEGDLILKEGELQKHSSSQVTGQKPNIYRTYDWPKVLAYFDVLPETHKEAVGYIFLTKESNTGIREEGIKHPEDYFAGIYFYENKKLHSIEVQNIQETQKFFDKAKTFFGDLPGRRLGPFSVGATTKQYAHNPKKADIYMPEDGSEYVFIHEVGHVQDFKYDFIDHHEPLYPFISAEMALNSYAATHPGEDFAEAYKYYVLSPDYFEDLIEEEPERQQKYDFLKQYVFEGREYGITKES